MQDQDSGKVIAKEPEHSRLFLLYLPAQLKNMSLFAFSCFSKNNVQLWHKKLGRSNTKVLLSLLNSDLIVTTKISANDACIGLFKM